MSGVGVKRMTAEDICRSAADVIGGDRQVSHGDKFASYTMLAELMTGFLRPHLKPGVKIKASEAATIMELLKITRRQNGSFNPDDYVDGCGYSGIAGELAAIEQRHKAGIPVGFDIPVVPVGSDD